MEVKQIPLQNTRQNEDITYLVCLIIQIPLTTETNAPRIHMYIWMD